MQYSYHRRIILHTRKSLVEPFHHGLVPVLYIRIKNRRRNLLISGGVDRFTEGARDARGTRWLDDLGRDVRHGFRSLLRSPGFTAAALLTVALGVGASTSVFSVVRGVLLKPLPHRDGDRLMYLRQSMESEGAGGENLAPHG